MKSSPVPEPDKLCPKGCGLCIDYDKPSLVVEKKIIYLADRYGLMESRERIIEQLHELIRLARETK